MAINRMTITGYGQLELNQVAFRRDGRIEAQCPLSEATGQFSSTVPAENGMVLAVDKANNVVKFAGAAGSPGVYPLALNYTAEKMYDPTADAYKDFALFPGEWYPRLGYLATGDRFTTNCISYSTGDYADNATLITALEACAETPLFGTQCTIGAIQIVPTQPTVGLKLLVTDYTDMPDGTPGVKFIVL